MPGPFSAKTGAAWFLKELGLEGVADALYK
jgi:hypothetical protein